MCMHASQSGPQISLPDGTGRGFDGQKISRRDMPLTVSSTGSTQRAVDVPLGDGFVDAGRLAILSRRERIRRAVEGQ